MEQFVNREFLERRARISEVHAQLAPIVAQTATSLCECLAGGGKVLFCGNGGSASDAQHIAAELVGRFVRERRALPAMALTTDTSILTAVANDYGYAAVFERQVQALAQAGDVLVAISTSGNSENIARAAKAARDKGCVVIGLTGKSGGRLVALSDQCVVVPYETTALIQELHITIGHIWCGAVDESLTSSES